MPVQSDKVQAIPFPVGSRVWVNTGLQMVKGTVIEHGILMSAEISRWVAYDRNGRRVQRTAARTTDAYWPLEALSPLCKHCDEPRLQHTRAGKCLFSSTRWEP
jgi:hypothetical protein